jgi:flagellar biosynthesis protein FliQ
MEAEAVIEVGRQAIFVLIKVSAPILLVALGIGLLISLFQALTQMQEATLSFVPKILSIFFALALLLPYIFTHLKALFESIIDKI